MRAGADVTVASVMPSLQVRLARGLKLTADCSIDDCASAEWDAIACPGGMPGAENLRDSAALTALLKKQASAGKLTARGKRMAALPLDPNYASLIASADTEGEQALAAEIAALASEPGIGGSSANLLDRLAGFRRDNSPRAKALKQQARRWAGNAEATGDPAILLAKAWPGQIARRRDGSQTSYLLANGRAGELAADSALAKAQWIVVADMVGAAGRARITLAAPIAEQDVLALHPPVTAEWASFEPASRSFKGRRVKAIGRIVLSETPLPQPSGDVARTAFMEFIKENGFEAAGLSAPVKAFLARLRLLHEAFGEDWPAPSEAELAASADDWLAPSLGGGTFRMPSDGAVLNALKQSLGWPKAQEIDDLTPSSIPLPCGRNAPVDYLDDNAPLVEAKAQELFGLTRQPTIAGGRLPVTLQLLSPAGRPIAVTKDIAGFWAGGYRDMAKDMRAQYPKHDWPDDPATAKPHAGMTKKRLGK